MISSVLQSRVEYFCLSVSNGQCAGFRSGAYDAAFYADSEPPNQITWKKILLHILLCTSHRAERQGGTTNKEENILHFLTPHGGVMLTKAEGTDTVGF